MSILATVLLALGILGLTFGYAATKQSFPKEIQLWNITVKADSSTNKMRRVWIYGLIAVVIGLALWIVAMVNAMSDFELNFLLDFILPILALFIPIPIGLVIGEKKTIKTIESNKNCLEIGVCEPIKKTDENINRAKTIEIFHDGIVLMDSTNYAFEKVVFSEHALGNLDNAKKMVAISCYFLQKYPCAFKRKYNENISTVTMTGDSVANAVASTSNIVASASGQGIISVKLIKI